jgi:YVTN family beta-propeller protein
LSSRPAALTFDSVHNYVYCLNPDRDSVTVVDAAFNTVASVVPVGDNPVALAWAPTADRMYAANHDGSSVSVINTTPPWVAERTTLPATRQPPLVVRGSLLLRGPDSALLLDVSGRRVLNLRPGVNDISGLAGGIYFLRTAAGSNSRKTLLLR